MGMAINKAEQTYRPVASEAECGDGEVFVNCLPAGSNYTLVGDAAVLSEIALLENSVTPRRLREAVLGTDGGWLAEIEQKIENLRKGISK